MDGVYKEASELPRGYTIGYHYIPGCGRYSLVNENYPIVNLCSCDKAPLDALQSFIEDIKTGWLDEIVAMIKERTASEVATTEDIKRCLIAMMGVDKRDL